MKPGKMNVKLSAELRIAINRSLEGNGFVEAFILAFALLEATLRYTLVGYLLEREKREEIVDQMTSGKTGELIERYYLLSNNSELFTKLKELNKKRNDLVHRLIEKASYEQVKDECRAITKELIQTERDLMQDPIWSKRFK